MEEERRNVETSEGGLLVLGQGKVRVQEEGKVQVVKLAFAGLGGRRAEWGAGSRKRRREDWEE